jgi:hypothetical protein
MPPTQHDNHTLGTHGYAEQWSPFGDQAAAMDPDPPVVHRHYGKFRGTVTNNEDPYFQGRLMVSVPGIVIANWATPCVPLTDISMGVFVRPRIGANVWVEFERGDPEKPIWVGCSWGIGGVPTMAKASAAVPPTNAVISIETALSGVTICDIPIAGANVLIRSPAATIMMNPAGIQINAPSVTITTGHFAVTAPNFTVE